MNSPDRVATAPSFHPAPHRPALSLPAGSCDTHVHVFGPASQFPYDPDGPFLPADAPKEKLFAVHELLGIERCVIVQSTCHGHDNSVVEDALAARRGRYRGIALLPLDIDRTELLRLDLAGFRGVRFNFMRHLGPGTSIESVLEFARQLAETGWHLQVHFDSSLIDELGPWFLQSPVPVVIDHMARIDASRGLTQPAFKSLLKLMQHEKIWVKVSGCDRSTRLGPPYADAVPFAAQLVREFGNRVLWGSDWPHPNHAGPTPDDGDLVDLLGQIAPDPEALQALMVDNPQRLYRFDT